MENFKKEVETEAASETDKEIDESENDTVISEPESEENGADADSDAKSAFAELEARFSELNDQYLRKAADFENFRKQKAKEKAEAIDFANQSLLLDLIPILDDFERALKSAPDVSAAKPEGQSLDRDALAAAFTSLREGVGMIENRLFAVLENKWGLKRYNSMGAPFDPAVHEALMSENSSEITEPTVTEEFVKGYKLKDRVIRTAKVKVAMPN